MTTDTRTLRILVACPGKITNDEWWPWMDPEPVSRDYALMKVLYMLREGAPTARGRRIDAFKWEKPSKGLDFSDLRDHDMILIVAHGSYNGLYALGPNSKKNLDRLVEILTKDGTLKEKRKGKRIEILLLSCRSGFGLHQALANRLSKELGRNVVVGGAMGYTFGSARALILSKNEVLIKGLPWYIEYPAEYKIPPRTVKTAENETEKWEKNKEKGKKKIKYKSKKTEIKEFEARSLEITTAMKDIIKKLKSTEVNDALDEIENKFRRDWKAWILAQFKLYASAKKWSNLDFDMWYELITDGYVWTDGKKMTDQEVDSFLEGEIDPTGTGGLTSIR